MQHSVAKNHPRALVWEDVRFFLAMVRAASLTAGARALGVDKATASRRVTALERAVGLRLFLRTREGLRLSAAGERLVGHAEAMEAAAKAIQRTSSTRPEEVAGLVRIATTEAMGERLVALGLLDLRQEYPELSLEILASNAPVDLLRDEADLALRVRKPESASLRQRLIARMPIGLYGSPEYFRRRGLPRSEAELAGHDLLIPSGELSRLPETRWMASLPNTEIVLRSSSLPALVAAAVRGHGLVALTEPWGDGVPGLTRAFTLEGLAPRPLWLLTSPSSALRPAVRVVAERLIHGFQTALRGEPRR